MHISGQGLGQTLSIPALGCHRKSDDLGLYNTDTTIYFPTAVDTVQYSPILIAPASHPLALLVRLQLLEMRQVEPQAVTGELSIPSITVTNFKL